MPAEATDTSDRIADPALLPHWLILGSATLPGRAAYVREARRLVASAIGADHPRADAALLLTSELVTNAVTHSRSRRPDGTVDVVVATGIHGLVVAVTDNGSDSNVPVIRNSPGAESGNGLLLVETLADAWGYRHGQGRTMVWFRLCPTERPTTSPARALLRPGRSDSRNAVTASTRSSPAHWRRARDTGRPSRCSRRRPDDAVDGTGTHTDT
ncbi:MAG TPA: ATP-binding protein [Streptosporangiaceae bacterium]|nr:ATP-binding protein [Streptosporangiaceae bacterium]